VTASFALEAQDDGRAVAGGTALNGFVDLLFKETDFGHEESVQAYLAKLARAASVLLAAFGRHEGQNLISRVLNRSEGEAWKAHGKSLRQRSQGGTHQVRPSLTAQERAIREIIGDDAFREPSDTKIVSKSANKFRSLFSTTEHWRDAARKAVSRLRKKSGQLKTAEPTCPDSP
jgi:hypothetical protein